MINKILNLTSSSHDEYYTPEYAVLPIVEYVQKGSIIWCPFDTKESNYVKILQKDFIVINSHIDEGKDFFEYTPEKFDYIISNPPYSIKNKVFKRLFELKKPFAMLIGNIELFGSKERFEMFKNNKFEIMFFDKRISFFKDFTNKELSINPSFSSLYLTSNVLPEKIIFKDLIKSHDKTS